MSDDPTHAFRMEAQRYACGKLKKLVRGLFTDHGGPRGAIIVEAVEALPENWTKFEQLTESEQKPLRAFLVQTEINYAADDVKRLIDEKYPRKP